MAMNAALALMHMCSVEITYRIRINIIDICLLGRFLAPEIFSNVAIFPMKHFTRKKNANTFTSDQTVEWSSSSYWRTEFCDSHLIIRLKGFFSI